MLFVFLNFIILTFSSRVKREKWDGIYRAEYPDCSATLIQDLLSIYESGLSAPLTKNVSFKTRSTGRRYMILLNKIFSKKNLMATSGGRDHLEKYRSNRTGENN